MTPDPPPAPPPWGPPAAPPDWAPSSLSAPPSAPPAPPTAGPDAGEDWHRPSPKLWGLRMLQLCLVGVVVIAVSAAIGFGANAAAGVAAVVVVLVVVGVVAFTLHRRVAAWGYAERQDDLLVRRGVLFRRMSIIPYGRMQFVDVTAGPLEQLFGLATVRMHTAAAASDARIPGLSPDEAARLRDQLTALGEAQAAGL